MKKIIFVLAVMAATAPALRAQQQTVHHLILTFYENDAIAGAKVLIETHDDGTQTRRNIHLLAPYTVNRLMEHEDTLMLALKPYFDQGWEITGSTAAVVSSSEYTTRIFLRKNE